MAGQPQHAAAEAPMAGAAGADDAVEGHLPHLGAQRLMAARVLLGRELLVAGMPVVGRAAHGVEGWTVVQAGAQLVPGKGGADAVVVRGLHRITARGS